MCGIAGRVNESALINRGQLFEMGARIAHRGPDDHGYHLRPRVGLAHRRLSIVDLAGGRQPLANEDDTVWIVFNGEIYNHLELRRQLVARGHRFRTRSDTEAIVHAYEEWGVTGCAERLRGMFAFAIWDERAQTLSLVRDRLGVKPLYYAELGGDLVFASEIKSLLAVPELDDRVDDEALAAYLSLRYVPAPATLFRGVRKLPPATALVWRHGATQRSTYWDLAEVPPLEVPPTEAEAALALRERIDQATRLRLMSEVPLGAFLSGGLDSTVITAAMLHTMELGRPLKTFSVGYADAGGDDELAFAGRAAAALGTEHRQVQVTSAEAAEALPRIVWHLDEPVADPACVPLYFLARLAKREVTVVLSGEGADEILAGYGVYARMAHYERLRRVSAGAVGLLARLGRHLPSGRARRLARLVEGPLESCYRGVSRAFDDDQRARLHPWAPPVEPFVGPHLGPRGWSTLRRMLYFDTRVWLPDDLLVKADKMTMAHAVELRVPFLDHELVEHVWRLPDRMKLKGGVGKALLRKAARGRVPRFVLERPKMGFATPTATWLRTDLYDLGRSAIFGPRSFTRDRFDLRYVERLLERHRLGRADLSTELWPLLVLELWHAEVARARHAPASLEEEIRYATP
jgi:asparagine synthase (glutamine-hydrolysing)